MGIRNFFKKTLMTLLLTGTMAIGACDKKNKNYAPEITSTPATTQINHNHEYAYPVQATDRNNDTLEYSLTQAPEGMTINSSTGLVQWTPTKEQTNQSYDVEIQVSDGKLTDSQSFQINVSNTAPVINTSELPEATEKQEYEFDVNASDNESDTLEYSLAQAPTGMTINPSTGRILWTPYDADSAQTHPVEIQVSDGITSTSKSVEVYARNVADLIKFTTKSCGSGDSLPGVTVFCGLDNQTTDSLGECTFQDKPDGEYDVIIKDLSGQYVTYKPGKLQVTKEREHHGKLDNLEMRLMPEEHYQFIDDCARSPVDNPDKDCIQKWGQKPKYKIYTKYYPADTPVEQEKINLVRDIILNRLSGKFYDSSGNIMIFEESDIESKDEMPYAGQPPNGEIKVYWRDDMSGGGNFTYFDNENRIIGATARGPPSFWEPTEMQELTENMIGSGETEDSNYSDSVLYSPSQPGNTNFSNNDNMWRDFHKNRPIGNRDLKDGNPENRDVNPSGTYINP